jgi:thiamine biosynthesis lipoprotein
MQSLQLVRKATNCCGSFTAMASPCELLMEIQDSETAEKLLRLVANEAIRLEHKFSRYRDDNITSRINRSAGEFIRVDDETARLLDFAEQLYGISNGLFDVTSGVLRRAWTFDGSDRIPAQASIDELLPAIGWNKVEWRNPELCLRPGMEIDFGGIGKEYAVDRCVQLLREQTDASVLVNFGGDLAITRERSDGDCWHIGRSSSDPDAAIAIIDLKRGALATSGDAHRFLLRDGKRYSHILNPKTGWPVEDPPHTVSVAAPTCIEAGMLSTLALLHGSNAEAFLRAQDVPYWIN